MDLIKCSECRKEISDIATNCVHCGCPITSSPVNSNSSSTKQSHGAISSEEAITLLKKYKPNFLVRLFKSQGFSGFLGKFIGMTIVFVVGGRFADIDMEVIIPILGVCFVLLWLGSLYPLVHFKGYCRRRHIDEAISKDTGYMNVAINAFNTFRRRTYCYDGRYMEESRGIPPCSLTKGNGATPLTGYTVPYLKYFLTCSVHLRVLFLYRNKS